MIDGQKGCPAGFWDLTLGRRPAAYRIAHAVYSDLIFTTQLNPLNRRKS
jgi:hypothetical protein